MPCWRHILTPGYPRRESHEFSMMSQGASWEVCADIPSKDFWKESFGKTGDPWHQWETEQSPRDHPDVQLSSIIRDSAGRDRWNVVCVWTSVCVSIWISDNKRRKDYRWIDNNNFMIITQFIKYGHSEKFNIFLYVLVFRLDYLVTYSLILVWCTRSVFLHHL